MKTRPVGQARAGSAAAPEHAKGLVANAIILTCDGEKRAADVQPGARVITRDCGVAVVRAVQVREVVAPALRIRAGTFGQARPERDVVLAAGQPLLVRDWRAPVLFGTRQALVPARRLADGEFISLRPLVRMRLVELQFDRPHILYVDGLEVGCHTETGGLRQAA
jgi:hypothetical protein